MSQDLDRRRLVVNSLWVGGLLLTGCRSDDDGAKLRSDSEPFQPSTLAPQGPQPPPQPSLKVRKALHTLTASSPEIVALKAGVKAMRARSQTRFDSWLFQANIHRSSCPHSNWFFLPWHRMYLYWFEQICRQASGDQNFVLPYWDWTADSRIPAFFYTDAGLNDPSRVQRSGEDFAAVVKRSNPGTTTAAAKKFVDQIFGRNAIDAMMATTRFIEFGSARSDSQRGQATFGSLESGPHNNAHGFVGGNMGQVAVSPRDPIFWLHHCNIDRLWAMWANGKGGAALPPNPAPGEDRPGLTTEFWKSFSLTGFSNLQGQPVTMKVSEVLDFKALGYTYDTIPAQSALSLTDGEDAPPAPSSMTTMPGKKALQTSQIAPQLGSSPHTPDAASARVLNLQVKIDEAMKPVLQTVQSGQGGFYPLARLAVSDLPRPKSDKSRVLLTFFVRAATDTATAEAQVGSFTFFTHADEAHDHGNTVNLAFDLKAALAALAAAGVDVARVSTLSVGIDVMGLSAYKEGASAFSRVGVDVTCFQ